MGVMSSLHLLAGKVKDNVEDGMPVDDAVDDVAEPSSFEASDVRWAYEERFE